MHNWKLNSPQTKLTYDSKLVESKSAMKTKTVITSKNCYVGITNIGNILVLMTTKNFDTSDVPDRMNHPSDN